MPVKGVCMAYASFAPIYTPIKRILLQRRDRVGYIVLDTLAQHADPYGWCYPGVQYLSELVGYAESTVQEKLQQFQEFEWIKIHQTWNPRRRQWEYDYQLSPNVLFIAEDYIDHAWAKWSNPNYELPPIERLQELKSSVTKKIQPEPEPDVSTRTEPEPSNQTQKPPPPPPNSPLTEKDQGTTAQSAKQEIANTETEKQPNGTKNSAKRQTEKEPPSSATPPTLAQYHAPLDEVDHETLAHIIKDEFGTRLPQARQIVATYGQARTEKAIEFVRQELKAKRPIQSAVGLVVWWLRNQAISYEDMTPAQAPNKSDDLSWDAWRSAQESELNHG